ncbi:OpgC family protein [Paracoccus onubensis]|uniref:OpgC domain-containing protein n=1 Tax=Paracoccus onubensis TaxID=1675788 RepID=A0A418SLW6_9RHOB|nr:OpgC domain-containing protein [Paracoccus onubensis]RJE81934.1 OpgC domain-containing protein [Paracoccus onubensis]
MSNPVSSPISAAKPARDPRLDFFRGLGMYIILIAHISGNPWTLWIPARFGFSDATEIFVFCSGMASAIAFGAVFRKAGWIMGALRTMHRVWQVYWAHIGLFFAILLAMVALDLTGWFNKDYVGSLNLYPFLNDPGPNLVGLMTLTYVPNYFDILPMYLVILAMLPLVMGLAGFHPNLAMGFCVILWLTASVTGFGFPAEYWFSSGSSRQWFFNPLTWQLVFFTGFAFMLGWLPAPPVNRGLIILAVVIVLATIPFAWFRIYREFEFIRDWRDEWNFLITKTDFGILRYVHFLSLAYLAWIAAGPNGSRLHGGAAWTAIVGVIRKVGQQSLAVFMTSMLLARLLGVLFDEFGRGPFIAVSVNLTGAVIITGVAYFVSYIKRQPWRQPVRPAADVKEHSPISGVRSF